MLAEDWDDAKLADYGVAKEQEYSDTSSFGAGTAAYVCPVAMKTTVRTTASDMYSLGLVLL